MNLQMIGIDHTTAAVEQRERFSFTKSRQIQAMEHFLQFEDICGCIILSTCNRTELYLSTTEHPVTDAYEQLCVLKQLPPDESRALFVRRNGQQAVRHLFSLAAGMQSRIVGEDQILMQVKQALSQSRECDCTDKVLEVLFRMAVTAGKKVKTEVPVPHANSSAVDQALDRLAQQGFSFAGTSCLVIGNGEMGKRTALALRELGADVTVTVRQYRSGMVEIPVGCHRIHYGERYEKLPQCSLIVSATASPNLTLRRQEIQALGCTKPQIYLDLAVPRDIDPQIAQLEHATVYDIDSFAISRQSEQAKRQIAKAELLLEDGVQEFISWYECRDFIPSIQRISGAAADDVCWRMGKTLSKMEDADRERVQQAAETAAKKVVAKLLFSLRDTADPQTLRVCLEAFRTAYPEEKQ